MSNVAYMSAPHPEIIIPAPRTSHQPVSTCVSSQRKDIITREVTLGTRTATQGLKHSTGNFLQGDTATNALMSKFQFVTEKAILATRFTQSRA